MVILPGATGIYPLLLSEVNDSGHRGLRSQMAGRG
jgi:hypothetical protein